MADTLTTISKNDRHAFELQQVLNRSNDFIDNVYNTSKPAQLMAYKAVTAPPKFMLSIIETSISTMGGTVPRSLKADNYFPVNVAIKPSFSFKRGQKRDAIVGTMTALITHGKGDAVASFIEQMPRSSDVCRLIKDLGDGPLKVMVDLNQLSLGAMKKMATAVAKMRDYTSPIQFGFSWGIAASDILQARHNFQRLLAHIADGPEKSVLKAPRDASKTSDSQGDSLDEHRMNLLKAGLTVRPKDRINKITDLVSFPFNENGRLKLLDTYYGNKVLEGAANDSVNRLKQNGGLFQFLDHCLNPQPSTDTGAAKAMVFRTMTNLTQDERNEFLKSDKSKTMTLDLSAMALLRKKSITGKHALDIKLTSTIVLNNLMSDNLQDKAHGVKLLAHVVNQGYFNSDDEIKDLFQSLESSGAWAPMLDFIKGEVMNTGGTSIPSDKKPEIFKTFSTMVPRVLESLSQVGGGSGPIFAAPQATNSDNTESPVSRLHARIIGSLGLTDPLPEGINNDMARKLTQSIDRFSADHAPKPSDGMGFSHQFSRQLHSYITDPNRSAQPVAIDGKLQEVYQELQLAQTKPKAHQNKQLRDLFKDKGITSSADQQAIGRRLAFAQAGTAAQAPMTFIKEFDQMLNTKVSDLVRTEHQAKLEQMVKKSREALGTNQPWGDFDKDTQKFLQSYKDPYSQITAPNSEPRDESFYEDLMAMLPSENLQAGVGQSP
ncbi:MAG: hypothetical protein ISQ13_04685, partial [Candidatus Margulisbacteria bacterium]|nr:hypothetical protein [Candidatus Margulisiibacteriota bacterium]